MPNSVSRNTRSGPKSGVHRGLAPPHGVVGRGGPGPVLGPRGRPGTKVRLTYNREGESRVKRQPRNRPRNQSRHPVTTKPPEMVHEGEAALRSNTWTGDERGDHEHGSRERHTAPSYAGARTCDPNTGPAMVAKAVPNRSRMQHQPGAAGTSHGTSPRTRLGTPGGTDERARDRHLVGATVSSRPGTCCVRRQQVRRSTDGANNLPYGNQFSRASARPYATIHDTKMTVRCDMPLTRCASY